MPRTTKSPAKSPAKPRASKKKATSVPVVRDDTDHSDDGVLLEDEFNTPPPTSSARNKPSLFSPFIDDEAADSDDGVLVDRDPHSPRKALRRRLATPEIDEPYEDDFINDGNPFDGASVGSVEITPPPQQPRTRQTPSRIKRDTLLTPPPSQPIQVPKTPGRSIALGKRRKPEGDDDEVIELSTSDEDLEAMDEDDSMFRKPAGIKAAALPPSLTTRSAAAKRSKTSAPTAESNAGALRAQKKAKNTAVDVDFSGQPAPNMQQYMDQWMATFMQKQLPAIISAAQASAAPPVVSDEVMSPDGNKRGTTVRFKPAPSPDWDAPYDGKDESASDRVATKGKAKAAPNTRGPTSTPEEVPASDEDDIPDDVAKFLPPDGRIPQTNARPKKLTAYFGDRTADVPVDGTSDPNVSDEFLQEIEAYRHYYNPAAKCGVSDVDLQDPGLRKTYADLPLLPGGRQIIPAYDPNRLAGIPPPDIKGGRVKYSTWKKWAKTIHRDNALGALLFAGAAPNFINPSRSSPLRASSQPSIGSTTTQRLHIDDRVAVCVSSLFATESKLVTPAKIGGKSERMRKWVAGIFHNQEWERFVAFVSLVFGEPVLRAQISTKNAVSFQTMISPENLTVNRDANDMFDNTAPADMFAPVASSSKTPSSPSKFTSARAKTLLAYNDRIPVYDARKVAVDFDSDLTRLEEILPPFIGEVPFGAFIVVGYTCSVYNAQISGSNERSPHLGCNILWVIVCGTH